MKGMADRVRFCGGRWVAVALAAFVAALTSAGLGRSVNAGQVLTPNLSSQHRNNPFGDGGDNDPAWTARRLRAMNEERQKTLVSDTEKLVRLATELHDELNAQASGHATGPLTPEQLRKLTQIEKLARNVREKMSQPVGDRPAFRSPELDPSIR